MQIRKARVSDALQIIRIVETNHIKNLETLEEGFLTIPDATREHYEKLLAILQFCYVAEIGGKVAGFLLACKAASLKKNEFIDYCQKTFGNLDFVYSFQTAVSPDHKRKGIAKALYQELFKDAKGLIIRASTSKKPYNRASEGLHLGLGFRKTGTFAWPDGIESFVYELNNSPVAGKKKVICFDVDGTLVEDKSSWLTLTAGLNCPVDKVYAVYEAVEKGKMPVVEGERLVCDMYRQSGCASKGNIAKIFEAVKIKDEAKDLMDYLKEKGFTVYLVSGAIDIYVESIAKRVGAAGFYSGGSLEFDGQGMIEKINYMNNQGPNKLRQIKELAANLGVAVEDMVFVGDSANDIEAFQATKHGIAVYPFDERLERIAWKTVKSLSEIKLIV